MKTIFSHTLAAVSVTFGLLTGGLKAADEIQAPTLEQALQLNGGGSVVFQPYQMKRGQSLLVTHTSFGGKKSLVARAGKQPAAMLVVYSTDSADYGHVLYQDIYIPAAATAGAGPHVKVFDGFTTDAERKGIIAILIGLLMPTDQTPPVFMRLPSADSISAEIHDGGTGIGLLLPAVQKVREAAAR